MKMIVDNTLLETESVVYLVIYISINKNDKLCHLTFDFVIFKASLTTTLFHYITPINDVTAVLSRFNLY